MFTGLVEEIGTLESITPQPDGEARLVLHGPLAASDAQLGDSIAVDGVCLTVVELHGEGRFAVDAVPETLRRSTLADARPGDHVNLERSVRADARLGGHIVQGHVDGVGRLLSISDGGRWVDLSISVAPVLAPLIAEKGSITVSGVSLTVTQVSAPGARDASFGISLIPATLEATTLGQIEPGDEVNLEVDVIARYVSRLQASGLAGAPAPAAVDATAAAPTVAATAQDGALR